jgi:hypothetical protein
MKRWSKPVTEWAPEVAATNLRQKVERLKIFLLEELKNSLVTFCSLPWRFKAELSLQPSCMGEGDMKLVGKGHCWKCSEGIELASVVCQERRAISLQDETGEEVMQLTQV